MQLILILAVEHFNFTLNNELCLLEQYNLTPTELFTIKLILLAKEENEQEWLLRYVQMFKLRPILEELQSKEIILKSWKLPKTGEKLDIGSILFNKNFIKQFYRASYEMGIELFENYPQSCMINNQYFNLRRISKKFDSLEDAYRAYGKAIRYKDETHKEILELIKWGKENNYTFTTLDSFLVDQDWKNIANIKNNGIININNDAIKLI